MIGCFVAWFSLRCTLGLCRTWNVDSTRIETKVTENAETKSLSYFQKHYVSYGGRYVRIPEKFCLALYEDFSAECGIDLPYEEFDLQKHSFPVDKMQSAATDFNSVVAYAVDSGIKQENGCEYPDLYVYDIKTQQTKKLKNDPRMWICGAIQSNIRTVSPGGRYIRIEANGATSAGGTWLYDIQEDRLDEQTAQSQITSFFSGEESPADNYVIYLAGCEKEEILDMGSVCPSILTLRDNRSGKTVVLNSVMDALRKKGMNTWSNLNVQYVGGTLVLSSREDLGSEVTIKDISTYLNAVK